MTFERLVYFSKHNSSINDSSQHGLDSCDSWTCTSDYTFTLVLIMNLGKSFNYKVNWLIIGHTRYTTTEFTRSFR